MIEGQLYYKARYGNEMRGGDEGTEGDIVRRKEL